jgi:CRP/FNR family transcriptional regulator
MRGIAMLDYASTGILEFAGLDRAAPTDKGKPGERPRPSRLLPEELKSLYEDAGRRIVAKEGGRLVQRGELFRDLYAVLTGSFKAFINDPRGREQVLSIFMPGDIIGFDAIETGRHSMSCVAMERSEIIAIPLDVLDGLVEKSPALLAELMQRMASKIALS